jgi:hypothetical protein
MTTPVIPIYTIIGTGGGDHIKARNDIEEQLIKLVGPLGYIGSIEFSSGGCWCDSYPLYCNITLFNPNTKQSIYLDEIPMSTKIRHLVIGRIYKVTIQFTIPVAR